MQDLRGNAEYSFITIAPGPLWPEVSSTWKVLSMGQIELFDIQIECKQMTCAKLNS